MTIWIAVVVALAVPASFLVYRRLRTDRATRMMETSARKGRAAREALSEADRRERTNMVQSLLDGGRYEEAFEAIERLLPAISDAERGRFANYVVYAFEGLAEEQDPRRVITLYEEMRAKGGALAFAEAEGKGDEIAHALAGSLRSFPAPKNAEGVRRFLDFIGQDSPLLNKARSLYPLEFAEQLDYRAAESLSDWEYGVSSQGLDATLARVRERLAGREA